MTLPSKTGTLKKLKADATAGQVTLDVPNDDPPPPTVERTRDVASGPMLVVLAGAKTGDTVTVEWLPADPGTATAVSRP
mgnify:CR=1 FL=1